MYNENDLNEMTLITLRAMCVKAGITGMSKKRKEIVISALMATNSTKAKPVAKKENTACKTEAPTPKENNYEKQPDNLNVNLAKGYVNGTTKITISCGAASQDFPVVGKTVAQVTSILTDVLSIPVMPKMLVRGKEVTGSYVLVEGDSLEYVKAAGKKG